MAVVISVNGDEGASLSRSGAMYKESTEIFPYFRDGKGKPGASAPQAVRGGAGGIIAVKLSGSELSQGAIRVEIIENLSSHRYPYRIEIPFHKEIVLTASGGKGEPGLDGRDGQPGMNGVHGTDATKYFDATNGANGGDGGDAGRGSNGGDGGPGGDIHIVTHESNTHLLMAVSWDIRGGQGGIAGMHGTPGAGGIGGRGGAGYTWEEAVDYKIYCTSSCIKKESLTAVPLAHSHRSTEAVSLSNLAMNAQATLKSKRRGKLPQPGDMSICICGGGTGNCIGCDMEPIIKTFTRPSGHDGRDGKAGASITTPLIAGAQGEEGTVTFVVQYDDGSIQGYASPWLLELVDFEVDDKNRDGELKPNHFFIRDIKVRNIGGMPSPKHLIPVTLVESEYFEAVPDYRDMTTLPNSIPAGYSASTEGSIKVRIKKRVQDRFSAKDTIRIKAIMPQLGRPLPLFDLTKEIEIGLAEQPITRGFRAKLFPRRRRSEMNDYDYVHNKGGRLQLRYFEGGKLEGETYDTRYIDESDVTQKARLNRQQPEASIINTNESASTALDTIFDNVSQPASTNVTPFSVALSTNLPAESTHEIPGPDKTEQLENLIDITRQHDEYSDAGSIADQDELYANILQNELLQDLDSRDLAGVEPLLPGLLEEFAIRIGHQGETQDHRNLMYIVHKHQQKITKNTCKIHSDAHEDLWSNEGSARGSLSSESVLLGKFDQNALYSDLQNVEHWNQKNDPDEAATFTESANVIEGQTLTERESREERLSFGHKALRESEAYRWLVSAVKQNTNMSGVRAVQMENHRNWLLTLLEKNTPAEQAQKARKVSRCRKPPLYTAKFDLAWDLLKFLQTQQYADKDLHAFVGRAITLSGNDQFVQALPCKEYMEQIWPSTGADFIRLLERLVDAPSQFCKHVLSDKTTVLAKLDGDTASFEVTGTKYGLAEAAEQLFWVATALRTPIDGPGTLLYFAIPDGTFDVDEVGRRNPGPGTISAQHVGTAKCSVVFETKPLIQEAQVSTGQCWHNLFHHCAIVYGYPIPSRPGSEQRPGLEIPFGMMAGLVGAERITPFCGNLIVKGFSTLLFPTRYDNGCMYWHLVHNDDGSRVSFADKRVLLSTELPSMISQLRLDVVNHARHIVGWTAMLKNNLGAIDANYKIDWSALRQPSHSLVLEKVQITAGHYITLGTTWAAGLRERPVHIKDRNDYVGRLKSLGNKYIVLHDVQVRKAWLVDGLSALVHLMRAYMDDECSNDYYEETCLTKPERFEAKGGCTGRKMAYATLIDPKNRNLRLYSKDGTAYTETEAEAQPDDKFYRLVDAVKDIMHLLEVIVDHQADERAEGSVGYRVRASPWEQLAGYDFNDIATKCDPIRPLEAKLEPDAEGWVDFTRAIHATTLFGKGFGELLEPSCEAGSPSHCGACYWNCAVPAQRDILAVSISELDRIATRRGSKLNNSWRLVDDLYLDLSPELFSACSPGAHRRCGKQRVQSIRRSTSPDCDERTVAPKKQNVFQKIFSKNPHRREQTTSVGELENVVTLDFSAGGILLGVTPRRRQKDPNKAKDAPKPSIRQRQNLPKTKAQNSPRTLHLQVPSGSFSSSNHTTMQNTSSTMHSNTENTSITEPSRVLSPALSADVTDEQENRIRRREESKGKAPIRQ